MLLFGVPERASSTSGRGCLLRTVVDRFTVCSETITWWTLRRKRMSEDFSFPYSPLCVLVLSIKLRGCELFSSSLSLFTPIAYWIALYYVWNIACFVFSRGAMQDVQERGLTQALHVRHCTTSSLICLGNAFGVSSNMVIWCGVSGNFAPYNTLGIMYANVFIVWLELYYNVVYLCAALQYRVEWATFRYFVFYIVYIKIKYIFQKKYYCC